VAVPLHSSQVFAKVALLHEANVVILGEDVDCQYHLLDAIKTEWKIDGTTNHAEVSKLGKSVTTKE
jgi:hypothetical protein